MPPSVRALVLLALTFAGASSGADVPRLFSRTADVDGVRLHYLTAGHGAALILLHGYTQTLRMWKPILPRLAARFTVIAPDLPGIGDSDIPAQGLDTKQAAIRIHALARSLGVEKAEGGSRAFDMLGP